jgi:hypothetical protein
MLLHVSSQFNTGEFGEHQRQTLAVKLAIPSQSTHVTEQSARGVAGVTTRECGNNNLPTSARRRRIGEEIVCSTASSLARAVGGRGKLPVANTKDLQALQRWDVLSRSRCLR